MATKFKVPREYAKSLAIKYSLQKISGYNLSMLGELKLRSLPITVRHWFPDVWGNHKHPSYNSARTSKHRISISVRGSDFDLPSKYKPRFPPKYGRKYRPVGQYRTIDECIVWAVGHEMFHFLAAHNQVPGDYKDEIAACDMGERWVEDYRLWKENT